ncbi:MAG: hypothetical protein UR26_C0007G0011 [candidate division TM6 bacterium GW2011_GWF2_32_72]|nr:MAG: hypothetical protein UR26_C0007G0011 [candidate division TM6 bacterium GW2011_GWF2_32_72]
MKKFFVVVFSIFFLAEASEEQQSEQDKLILKFKIPAGYKLWPSSLKKERKKSGQIGYNYSDAVDAASIHPMITRGKAKKEFLQKRLKRIEAFEQMCRIKEAEKRIEKSKNDYRIWVANEIEKIVKTDNVDDFFRLFYEFSSFSKFPLCLNKIPEIYYDEELAEGSQFNLNILAEAYRFKAWKIFDVILQNTLFFDQDEDCYWFELWKLVVKNEDEETALQLFDLAENLNEPEFFMFYSDLDFLIYEKKCNWMKERLIAMYTKGLLTTCGIGVLGNLGLI